MAGLSQVKTRYERENQDASSNELLGKHQHWAAGQGTAGQQIQGGTKAEILTKGDRDCLLSSLCQSTGLFPGQTYSLLFLKMQVTAIEKKKKMAIIVHRWEIFWEAQKYKVYPQACL